MAATLFGLGLLAVGLAPQASLRVARQLCDRPCASAAWVLGVLVLGVLLVLVLFLTIVGLPLALFLTAAGVLALFFAKLSAAYGLGLCLLPRIPDRQRWLAFTLGYAVLTVLTFVPFVGPLVNLAASGLGLGMLCLALGPVSPPAPTAAPAPSAASSLRRPTEPVLRADPLPATPPRPARERSARRGPALRRSPRTLRSRPPRRRPRAR